MQALQLLSLHSYVARQGKNTGRYARTHARPSLCIPACNPTCLSVVSVTAVLRNKATCRCGLTMLLFVYVLFLACARLCVHVCVLCVCVCVRARGSLCARGCGTCPETLTAAKCAFAIARSAPTGALTLIWV